MLKSDEGKTISYWEATEDLIRRDTGEQPAETDVCIVGGGISGLTTAYLLSRAGKSVTVIDDGLIGGGETSRTTAHLSNAIDDRIYRIEDWHGEDKAALAVEAHTSAIDKIDEIVTGENIDCDLVRLDGYLFEAEDGEDDLEKEFEAARRCGMANVEWADKAPMSGVDTGKCLRFPRQGQFHVLKYLSGLAKAIESAGGRLVSNTRVLDWQGEKSPRVRTDRGELRAGSIVLATNYPLKSKMFARLPAYRTYAVGLSIPKGSVEQALFWDTADPYIYVRTQSDGENDLLIVGGEDHKTGHENDGAERFERLRQWAVKHFPEAGEVLYQWSGQFMETHDGLAFIGPYSSSEPNVYLITGDSGMGMTHGTIGGMMVSDMVLGKENRWAEVFDPSRIATQSIKEAVPELISSTTPYTDWITGGDISSADELKNGEGGILREGLSKIAVFRDDSGKVHRRSAVCTHMGCIVRFNALEKTWDCPCHGSRFSTDGEAINAPAIEPLGAAD